jgi:hypothetical protein
MRGSCLCFVARVLETRTDRVQLFCVTEDDPRDNLVLIFVM